MTGTIRSDIVIDGGVCPVCGGHGVYGLDVPLDHPLYNVTQDCTCEAGERRRLEKQQRRLQAAHLPLDLEALTFESMQGLEGQTNIDGEVIRLSEKQRSALRMGAELVEAGTVATKTAARPGLFLYGQQGRGKSGVAVSVVRQMIQNGRAGVYITVPDLLDHLRATFAPDSEVAYDDLFEQVRGVSVLVMDDLGTEKPTSWALEKLFQIVNHRYQHRLVTLVTSNYSPSMLTAQYDQAGDWTGKRLIDRLVTMCAVVEVTGPNLRR